MMKSIDLHPSETQSTHNSCLVMGSVSRLFQTHSALLSTGPISLKSAKNYTFFEIWVLFRSPSPQEGDKNESKHHFEENEPRQARSFRKRWGIALLIALLHDDLVSRRGFYLNIKRAGPLGAITLRLYNDRDFAGALLVLSLIHI